MEGLKRCLWKWLESIFDDGGGEENGSRNQFRFLRAPQAISELRTDD